MKKITAILIISAISIAMLSACGKTAVSFSWMRKILCGCIFQKIGSMDCTAVKNPLKYGGKSRRRHPAVFYENADNIKYVLITHLTEDDYETGSIH